MKVVRKTKKGYYNTLTKKYVSESYAKRLNSYFKRNPKATLYRAGGHGKYERKKALSEHGKQVIKIAYGQKTQVVKTRTKKKKVYYSPLQKEILTEKDIKKFKKLEFHMLNKKAFVELYRLTRSRETIYHIITWEINQSFNSIYIVDMWERQNKQKFMKLLTKLFNLAKHYKLSHTSSAYGHVTYYSYSAYDGREFGKTFGFVIPNKSGFDIMVKEFGEILDLIRDKLEYDSYRRIALLKITLYLRDNKRNCFKLPVELSKYRIGVNRV